jgi:hypothetical protein
VSKKRIAIYSQAVDSKKWKVLILIIDLILSPIWICPILFVVIGEQSERLIRWLMNWRTNFLARVFWLFNWDGVRKVEDDE